MAAAISRIVARRTVGRSTPTAIVGRSTPTAIVSRRASTGKVAPPPPPPPPPTANQIWLKNAIDALDQKATLEIHALEAERRALARAFFANKASYAVAVSEAHRMVGVSSWRIWMVVASFALTSYHMVREAEHRASEGASK